MSYTNAENVAFIALVCLLLAFTVVVSGVGPTRGSSDYSGQAVDLENQKGLVMPTTQVHLKTDARSSESEEFCVHPDNRDEQLETLRQAVSNGDRVTISYSRPLWVAPWECDGSLAIIDNVTVHEDEVAE